MWRTSLALLVALLLASLAEAQAPTRCLVSTNPPVWADASYQFLSCQTDGKLRTTTASGAAGGTFSSFGAAFPSDGTAGGFSDGTNMQGARVFDLDTGGGTQYILGVNLRQASGGGSVELGTLTNPLRIDPTGTTTQPISAASLPLPANAATDRATAGGPFSFRLSDGAAFYDAAKTGQLPAALVGGRLDVLATQSGTWNITNISGTVSLPTGAAQEHTAAATPNATRLSDGAAFYDARDRSWTITESVTVTGPLTDTQLRATPVPVSGTVSVTANSAVNVAQVNGATPTASNPLPVQLSTGTSFYPVMPSAGLPKPPCNPVRRTYCQ